MADLRTLIAGLLQSGFKPLGQTGGAIPLLRSGMPAPPQALPQMGYGPAEVPSPFPMIPAVPPQVQGPPMPPEAFPAFGLATGIGGGEGLPAGAFGFGGGASAPGSGIDLGSILNKLVGQAEPAAPAPAPEAAPARSNSLASLLAPMLAGGGGQARTTYIPGSSSAPVGASGDPISSYMGRLYGAESGDRMVPNAAGASSAFGPAQFTKGTWLDTVQQEDPETWRSLGGDSAKVLALRSDPAYHKTMAEAFTRRNAEELTAKGLPVNDTSLYAMHFFGRGDGPKVLAADPTTPLSDIVSGSTISANPQLRGMTAGQAVGWAGKTIGGGGEAPGGLPSPTQYSAPQIGTPPELQALKTRDPASYDRFDALSVVRPPPLSQGDRVTNILAAMAQGAQGAKSIGDFLLGAGGGALSGAAGLSRQQRTEDLRAAEKQSDLDILKAGKGVEKAGAVAEQSSAQINAANTNALNAWHAAVDQAKLDTEAKNKTNEARHKIDLLAFERGEPEVVRDADGLTVYRKGTDGSLTMTNIPSSGAGSMAKRVHDMRKMLDDAGVPKDSSAREPIENSLIATMGYQLGGVSGVRAMLLDDLVDKITTQGQWKDILPPKVFADLEKRVQASFTPQEMQAGAKAPEIYQKKFKSLLDGEISKNPRMAEYIARQAAEAFGTRGAGATGRLYLGQ
jgi:hypothetical protein